MQLKEILKLVKFDDIIGIVEKEVKEPEKLNSSNTDSEIIMWASDKYYHIVKETKEGIIICSKIETSDIQPKVTYLLTNNPRQKFKEVLANFFVPKIEYNIHKTAYIHDTAIIGNRVSISHNVVIEKDCRIGENVIIGANTVIKEKTIIGNNVTIGSNNTIGGVGFGYEKNSRGEYEFIPHLGNVIIHDGVDIGNNTCIDRAVLGSTILETNAKVDNLVHIAHGVVIGENSLIIANAMVAGSVKIGKNVWVAPSSSIINGIQIIDDTIVGMGAVVVKPVIEKSIIVGNPGRPLKPRN